MYAAFIVCARKHKGRKGHEIHESSTTCMKAGLRRSVILSFSLPRFSSFSECLPLPQYMYTRENSQYWAQAGQLGIQTVAECPGELKWPAPSRMSGHGTNRQRRRGRRLNTLSTCPSGPIPIPGRCCVVTAYPCRSHYKRCFLYSPSIEYKDKAHPPPPGTSHDLFPPISYIL